MYMYCCIPHPCPPDPLFAARPKKKKIPKRRTVTIIIGRTETGVGLPAVEGYFADETQPIACVRSLSCDEVRTARFLGDQTSWSGPRGPSHQFCRSLSGMCVGRSGFANELDPSKLQAVDAARTGKYWVGQTAVRD